VKAAQADRHHVYWQDEMPTCQHRDRQEDDGEESLEREDVQGLLAKPLVAQAILVHGVKVYQLSLA
jgi:hypothetical protein